jgi:hypothetical protein
MGLSEIRLEVFNHNSRAIAAYSKVGFVVSGEHVEWVAHRKTELRVIEMRLARDAFHTGRVTANPDSTSSTNAEATCQARKQRRKERKEIRTKRRAERASHLEGTGPDPESRETMPAAELTDPN